MPTFIQLIQLTK